MMRLAVPRGFTDWWDRSIPSEALRLRLSWRSGAPLAVGELCPRRRAVRFDPDPEDFTKGAERTSRILAKAFTRAGWLRPSLDPAAMPHLLSIRKNDVRVEFIMDTNAMVEGIGHWLVDVFADRCDLVVTAVTLRELQDQHACAGFSKELTKKPDARGDQLGARQLYLAANRFRERPGYERVLWRELELDDTALLLSRGTSSGKSSESDTLLLRAVRRSIQDRVNGLERFFVTGDTALARRATSELPPGSVIAAQVQELAPGAVYFPSAWWPGPDQGNRIVRHCSRLVWELLAVGDTVTLEAEDGRVWSFRAFDDPMWPSDYREPWVHVEGPSEPSSSSGSEEGGQDSPDAPEDSGAPAQQGLAIEAAAASPIWPSWVPPSQSLDMNLRIPAAHVLDLLASLALHPESTIPIPEALRTSSERRHHVRLFLESLNLAKPQADGATADVLPAREQLRDAWMADDGDRIFDLVRVWSPLDEVATSTKAPKRPEKTLGSARKLAALLGQGAYVDGRWLPGGARPSANEIREALVGSVPSEPPQAVSIFVVLVDVFLRTLRVSPVRAKRAWSTMWKAGIFADFEPRTGGSSSGRHTQEVARFTATGWEISQHDLESHEGYRDVVWRRSSNE